MVIFSILFCARTAGSSTDSYTATVVIASIASEHTEKVKVLQNSLNEKTCE